ncbi:hypothetical protein INT47_004694 [Mucor saturninus]|uniref:Hcy-binding domain-containing protein n=1 Tax=Mucor saturninus TaxID=64648 RepID=A0A8H7QK53_9FUNG|nr:hypothetical protein INT47_004694 [Mucor saturninus]
MSFQFPLILDGGFATELERSFGKDLSGKLWSATCIRDDPDAIKFVHRSYYEAGATVATTCSYQASLQGFAEAGYSRDQAIGFMQKSVALACQARDEYEQAHPNSNKLVALSMGCYGAVLANGAEYTGDYGNVSVQDLVRFHKERLDIFLSTPDTKVDMIIFETIPSYLEAQAIAEVVKETKLPPVAVAFQCRSGDQIADGTSVVQALEAVNSSEIFATGVNCTKPEFVQTLLAIVYGYHTESTGQALIAYPDGGESWDAVARQWDSTSRLPEEAFGCMMAQCMKDYGPRVLVGGCCGTGPNHIKSILEN